VERGNESVYPELKGLAVDQSKAYTSRIHALWTLYELNYDQADVYFSALEDSNEHVRALGVRLLEGFASEGEEIERRLEEKLSDILDESSRIVNLPTALSAGSLDATSATPILLEVINRYYPLPLFRDAVLSSLTNHEMEFMKRIISQREWQTQDSNRAIVIEMLSSAISKRAEPVELNELLSMISVDPERFEWQHESILEGMALYSLNQDTINIDLQRKPMIITELDSYDSAIREKITTISGIFDWPGKKIQTTDTETGVDEVEVDPEQFAYGRQQYLSLCSSCHGNDGRGVNRFAPPLRNSEWVLESEKRLALILLHGMEGPVTVAGKEYDVPEIQPKMPSFSTFDAEKLAAIMTYIRREWGHRAEPVSPRTVGQIRVQNQGSLTP